jgi:ABC-type transporter Mla MlaB component
MPSRQAQTLPCTREGKGDQELLKISFSDTLGQEVTIRLEGQVSGPWVEELRRSCERLLLSGARLTLDMTDVSFIDKDGIALCQHLRTQQVALTHCSAFVVEQLRG